MLNRILPFALLLSAPVFAQEAKPSLEAEVLLDHWTITQMAGAPVGYVHTRVTQTGKGEARVIKTAVITQMKIKRLGSTIEIRQSSDSFEKPDGQLIRIDSAMQMSNNETRSQIFFDGREARVVTELLGRKREQKINCPDGMVGPYRLHMMAVEKGFKPGTKWSAQIFVGDLLSASIVSNEVIGPEEIDLGKGGKRKLTKVIVIMEKLHTRASTWVDANGLALKVTTTAAGINMVMTAATKADALAAVGGAELSPDVFKATMLVAKEFLPYSRRTTGAVMRVTAKDATMKITLPTSKRQVVGSADASGVYTLRMSRTVPASDHKGVRPLANVPAIPSDIKDCLGASTMIQSDEAEIIAIAKEAVGSEINAWRAAQKLERWVNINLTNKGYGVGFASALEVCRDRSGDCSEHAVLLAALCRAVGIPTKVSMGVLYIGGIWGGHAWNEVWIDGDWYALDATIGMGSVDALHLTMVSASMRDGNGFSELVTMNSTMGNLKIRVETIELDGKSLPVAGKVTVDGRRYMNRLWGFSCEAPAGFENEPIAPSARIAFCVLEIEGKNSTGKKCEIKVHVYGTQPSLDHKKLARGYGRGTSDITDIEVDGRRAKLLVVKRRSGRRTLIAVVDAKTAVYVIELDRAPGDEDTAMFKLFLAEFDFDLAR